jgi:hypothetical protein
MKKHSPTAAWIPEAISGFEVEYSDVRRVGRFRGRGRGMPQLLRLEGYFSRNRFEFDFYTKGLEGELVAFVGRPLGLPFLGSDAEI